MPIVYSFLCRDNFYVKKKFEDLPTPIPEIWNRHAYSQAVRINLCEKNRKSYWYFLWKDITIRYNITKFLSQTLELNKILKLSQYIAILLQIVVYSHDDIFLHFKTRWGSDFTTLFSSEFPLHYEI